jgi:hypothetical protein
MTRAEMLARVDSRELSAWWVLFEVQADEDARRQKTQRDLAESGDGIVIEHGRRSPDDDDDADDDVDEPVE